MKYYILLIFFVLLFGCNNANKQSNKAGIQNSIVDTVCNCEISSIEILYYNNLFINARARNWDDLKLEVPSFLDENNRDGILDARITDCAVLKEIDSELKHIRLSDEQYRIDIRIIAVINYKDGSEKKISIGDIYSTDIAVDGEVLDSSGNKLKFLIKNNIGFYSWMDKKALEKMDELNDTTYSKVPFIESPYYKLYKEIKNTK